MFFWVFILILLTISFVDLFLLLVISRGIGIAVIVVTQLASASWGLWKISKMDFNLIFFLDAELKKREPIVLELWEETLILTGACLLVIPGFLSDILGIGLLIPTLRTLCLEFIDDYSI